MIRFTHARKTNVSSFSVSLIEVFERYTFKNKIRILRCL